MEKAGVGGVGFGQECPVCGQGTLRGASWRRAVGRTAGASLAAFGGGRGGEMEKAGVGGVGFGQECPVCGQGTLRGASWRRAVGRTAGASLAAFGGGFGSGA